MRILHARVYRAVQKALAGDTPMLIYQLCRVHCRADIHASLGEAKLVEA
jgi:hypothetical protein